MTARPLDGLERAGRHPRRCSGMHRKAATLVILVLGLGPACVRAAGALGGHAAATTDYVFRGVSQTRGDPAVQVDVHYQTQSGWFAGAWASTVDLNPGAGATVELNAYAGRAWPVAGDWNARVTAVQYVYPNDEATFSYDYFELIASVAWLDRLVASVAWSPDTSRYAGYYGAALDRRALTYEVVGRWPVQEALSATVSAGYYDLSDLFDTGYGYGSLGLTYEFKSLQLDLAWFATADRAEELFGREIAGDRWSFTVAWRFP
jgi:uncharacterized protein (TIGR02001 family)